jgi:hypothetical protein
MVVVFSNTFIKPYRLGGNEELTITRWNYALDEIEPNKTKFSYSVFLTNKSEGNISIRTLKPEYKIEILNDIEYKDVIIVSEEIMPKEVLEVNWDIIINKNGLTVKEIKEFLTSITLNASVKGENVINHDLVTTFFQ